MAGARRLADCHVHLEAGLRLVDGTRDRAVVKKGMASWSALVPEFDAFEAALTICVNALGAVGASYASIRFNPVSCARRFGCGFDALVASVRSVSESTRESGLDWRCLITMKLEAPVDEWWSAVEFASQMPLERRAGIDISRSYSVLRERPKNCEWPSWAAGVCRAVLAEDLTVAAHNGWYDSSEDLWFALDELGASRVGHAFGAYHDVSLMRRLAADKIVVEVCPTASVVVGKHRLESHPARNWQSYGVLFVLGSDHPLELGTDIRREYYLMGQTFGSETLSYVDSCVSCLLRA